MVGKYNIFKADFYTDALAVCNVTDLSPNDKSKGDYHSLSSVG